MTNRTYLYRPEFGTPPVAVDVARDDTRGSLCEVMIEGQGQGQGEREGA